VTRPDIPATLEAIAALIEAQAAAGDRPAYAHEELLRAAPLLRAAAQAVDGAAAWRVAEIRAWQALFATAAPSVDDPALAEALRQAAATGPDARADAPALHVSALEMHLGSLRALAITLHAWTDTAASPAAASIGRALWAELRLGTERRRSPLDRL
jgi:hypothetical protein